MSEPSTSQPASSTKKRGWGASIFSRRNLLVAAGAAAGLGLYTWQIEPHWIMVVERDMPIVNLPAALQGKTLVQISDLHVGDLVETDYLIGAMQKVSALRPDITVITGDLMSCYGKEQVDHVGRVLKHLAISPLGCYAILGNHDYGMRWRREDAADALVKTMADCGIQTLRNEMQSVEGLQIVGVDDMWGPRFDPQAILPQVNWNQAALTLCHNPDAVDREEFQQIKGWILSGHTHGGQCKPPFLPPPLLPVQNHRYTSGEFDIEHGRQLYISRGLGFTMHVRFNAPPEITLFRLVKA